MGYVLVRSGGCGVGGVRCPHDAPMIGVQPITVNQLQTLIYIHLHWFVLKILGISMIFRGDGVVPGRVWGWGWCRSKEKCFKRILKHIYLQSIFRSSFQSNANSFNMKYTYI